MTTNKQKKSTCRSPSNCSRRCIRVCSGCKLWLETGTARPGNPFGVETTNQQQSTIKSTINQQSPINNISKLFSFSRSSPLHTGTGCPRGSGHHSDKVVGRQACNPRRGPTPRGGRAAPTRWSRRGRRGPEGSGHCTHFDHLQISRK